MDNAENEPVDSFPDAFPGNQPGSVIAPSQGQAVNPVLTPPQVPIAPQPAANIVSTPPSPAATQTPEPSTLIPSPIASQVLPTSTPPLQDSYDQSTPANSHETEEGISWTAPEFVEKQKNASWHFILLGVAVILGVVLYLLTKDAITTGMVVFAILILSIYGMRRPKNIEYSLGRDGMNIGIKRFNYEAFRSFTVIPEGSYTSVNFVPLKRFAPPIGLCILKEDEADILNFLSARLPNQIYKPDIIERLMQRINF
jgi:hypothetical protein